MRALLQGMAAAGIAALFACSAAMAAKSEMSEREILEAKIEAAAAGARPPTTIILPPRVEEPRFLGWGIKQGLNAARLHGQFGNDVGGERIYGYAIGVHAELRVTDETTFTPELLYSERGGRGEFALGLTGGGVARIGVTSHLRYVEMPLLLRFGPARGVWRPHLICGASLSYKVDYKSEVTTLVSGASPAPIRFAQIFEDIGTIGGGTDPYENFDWGPVLGAGMRFDAGRTHVLLEGRLYRGIPTILPREIGEDMQNGVFSLYAGLEFPSLLP